MSSGLFQQAALGDFARRIGKRIRFHRDRLMQWYFNDHVQPVTPPEPVQVEVPSIKAPGYRLRCRRGYWHVQVTGIGKEVERSLKRRELSVAKDRAPALVAKIRAKVKGNEAGECTTSIDDAVVAYINHVEANRLAPRTIANYRWSTRQLQALAKERGVTDLPAINLSFLDAYQQKRNADGVAPKTLFNEVIAIKQLLNFAVTRDMIASNPLKRVRMPRPKPPPQPFWTIEQVDAILDAAKEIALLQRLLAAGADGHADLRSPLLDLEGRRTESQIAFRPREADRP